MKRNYYDCLEINQNASPEIIEKAYKTLVKKYHPDLQQGVEKEIFETKLKEINEAYEILSNPEKKAAYDATLIHLSQQELESLLAENTKLKEQKSQSQIIDHQPTTTENDVQSSLNPNLYQQELNNAINQAYRDAYVQDLKNRGYKIRYKKTPKDLLRTVISIILTIVVLFVLFQIPFIHNYFVNLYEENMVIHQLVDLVKGIFPS